MSTRNRPWKTWKQYAKLNVISKILNVIKAKRVWMYFRREEKGKYFIQWAARITNWRIKRGKITCECFTFERELLLENSILEWFDNDEKMVELLSRLAVKVRFITKFSKIFSNFLQKYFWIFFIFHFFFELGWNPKKKILVRELNEPLKCQICSGYLINPTVVNECQHTFCKTVSKYVSIDQPSKL